MDIGPYTSIATLLAVFVTFWLSVQVGNMRHKHGIKGPDVTGNAEFERTHRTHQNTIEQLVMFLPVMWLSVGVLGDLLVGVIGLIWVAGRYLYARAYMAGEDRGFGMWMTAIPLMALFVIAAFGAVRGLIA